jgi:hypothetical protein
MYRMALTWILMLQMWPSGAVKFIPVGSTPGGAPRMPFIGRMQLFLATGNRLPVFVPVTRLPVTRLAVTRQVQGVDQLLGASISCLQVCGVI